MKYISLATIYASILMAAKDLYEYPSEETDVS